MISKKGVTIIFIRILKKNLFFFQSNFYSNTFFYILASRNTTNEKSKRFLVFTVEIVNFAVRLGECWVCTVQPLR